MAFYPQRPERFRTVPRREVYREFKDEDCVLEFHREKAMNYLNHWGYEIEDGGKNAPFLPRNPGSGLTD